MEEQVQQFQGLADDERLDEHRSHFLDYTAPCLTEFFLSCEDPKIGFHLEDSGLRMAHKIALGLIDVANGSDQLTNAQAARMDNFREVMVRIVHEVGVLEAVTCVKRMSCPEPRVVRIEDVLQERRQSGLQSREVSMPCAKSQEERAIDGPGQHWAAKDGGLHSSSASVPHGNASCAPQGEGD